MVTSLFSLRHSESVIDTKQSLKVSATFLPFKIDVSFSTRVIFESDRPLSEKAGFTVFKSFLISAMLEIFNLLYLLFNLLRFFFPF